MFGMAMARERFWPNEVAMNRISRARQRSMVAWRMSAVVGASLFVALSLAGPVAAISNGYEWQFPNNAKVYMVYPPRQFRDGTFADAKTPNPMTFWVWMHTYSITSCVWIFCSTQIYNPDWFHITVFVRDTNGNGANWYHMEWFDPTSTSQNGANVQWSFSATIDGGYASGSIGATVAVPDSSQSFNLGPGYEYTDGGGWKRIGFLNVDYNQWVWWGDTATQGAFKMSLDNAIGTGYFNHLFNIKVVVDLQWRGSCCGPTQGASTTFILGDYIPSYSDTKEFLIPGTITGS
jgi:hypothetical protein